MNELAIVLPATIGALIGALASLGATWYQVRRKEDYFDKKAIRYLESKIAGKKNGLSWAEVSKHGKNIGMTENEIKQLLFLSKAELLEEPTLHWCITAPGDRH